MAAPNKEAQATFALGCFWGKEYLFQQVPGVRSTRVGYTGGHTEAPSYLEVCSKRSGHAEAVEIRYDPECISYAELLRIFFANHNPTSRERQGADHEGNYRSAIFTHGPEQAVAARALIKKLRAAGYDIVTQVAARGPFYAAEARHQAYCQRTGNLPRPRTYPIDFTHEKLSNH
ncbi:MAG: peptide-methionine (S)-S-oxide reductase MsrA [Bacteroidota bacterium]